MVRHILVRNIVAEVTEAIYDGDSHNVVSFFKCIGDCLPLPSRHRKARGSLAFVALASYERRHHTSEKLDEAC